MPAKIPQRTDKKRQYFHIYNRGVENRVIFNDKQDYETFLGYLRDYLSPPPDPKSVRKNFTVKGRVYSGIPHQPKNFFNQVGLIAYCLEANHFHLLLEEKVKSAIQRFNRSLFTRYSMYFNRKYSRSGTLFGGRYKSIVVENELSLALLTREFHSTKARSSYPEYLGKKATSWVKTKSVLSLTKRRGMSYQNFVEKYKLDQKEKELLERCVFKSETEPIPVVEPETEPVSQSGFGFSELTAATIVFTVLLFLGLGNIRGVAGQSREELTSNPNPEIFNVKGKREEAEAEETETETEAEIEEAEVKKMVIIKVDDELDRVNIRQKPTVMSEKIGQAKNGDSFEFVSIDSDWYEIKLNDNLIGFISAELAQIKGEDN